MMTAIGEVFALTSELDPERITVVLHSLRGSPYFHEITVEGGHIIGVSSVPVERWADLAADLEGDPQHPEIVPESVAQAIREFILITADYLSLQPDPIPPLSPLAARVIAALDQHPEVRAEVRAYLLAQEP